MQNRRYSDIEITQDSNTGKRIFRSTVYNSIEESNDDIWFYTQEGDRLDLLANEYYQDQNLWWYLAIANNMKTFSYVIEAGTLFRIPPKPTEAARKILLYNIKR